MGEDVMKAVVLLGERELEIREVPVPVPGPGEVLVRVGAATTCGTDLKIYRRGHPKFPPPFIFGHEFGGEIAAVGEGVSAFREGMRVTANVFGECGECFYCRKGQGNLCENLEYNFGAYAEYNLVPASIVRRTMFEIPEGTAYEEAAVLEPLVCVVHAAGKLALQPGERVGVIGAGGPISLLFIQMLKLAGASDIVAVGHSDFRLELAARAGATRVINSNVESPELYLDELTAGYGLDAVVECAGALEAWVDAVRYCRRGGRVLWFGGLAGGTEVPIDAARVHYGEITLLNTHGGTALDARKAFDLISEGKVSTRMLISDTMPMGRIEEALQRMIDGRAVKIALVPGFD